MPTTRYIWDELDDCVMMETDENGNVTAEYTTEPEHHGELISERRNGVEHIHHYDGQGNTIALTDESGNVSDTWVYTAFGEVVDRTGTTETPYQFGGQFGYQTDSLTGDIYIRERIYEPTNQRWLSTDPVEDELARSAYMYALNNPITYVDPSGLWCGPVAEESCCCCAKKITFANVGLKPWDLKDPDTPPEVKALGGGLYWGVDIGLHTVWKPSAEYKDCTLKFYEKSNQKFVSGGVTTLPGNWANHYDPRSPTFKPWETKPMVTECDAKGTPAKPVTIHDKPSIQIIGGKAKLKLFFAVVLRSAEDCPCDDVEGEAVENYATLLAELEKLVPPTPTKGSKLKVGKLPDYPDGLPLDKKKWK